MKKEFIQIRLSAEDKTRIKQSADAAHMDMSGFILSIVLSEPRGRFSELIGELRENENNKAYCVNVLAAVNDFLVDLTCEEFREVFESKIELNLNNYYENYVAAFVEELACKLNLSAPDWLNEIEILEKPVFGEVDLSLRLYLLTNSRPAFVRRNIFVDTGLGGRV